jgi:hypothetical protein
MVQKFISVNYAIRKIINNLGINDKEVALDDYIEWIGEALQYIGSYYQYCEKPAIIEIEDYKGELPCDFCKLISIKNGYDNLRNNFNKQLIGNNTQVLNKAKHSERDYNLNGDVITVSFRKGTLHIQYLAIPLDSDGLPMIPDDINYLDAMVWKCAYQLSIRGYTFKSAQLNNFQWVEAKWNRYCLQARTSLNSPDLDALERIKNIVVRFKPDLNAYYNDFKNLGKQTYQHEINDYRANF